jgi:hypothetical protein
MQKYKYFPKNKTVCKKYMLGQNISFRVACDMIKI